MTLFRFERPEFLWWLLGLLAMIIVFVFVEIFRKRKMSAIGDNPVVAKLIAGESKFIRYFKFILLLLSFALIIVGIANPQVGSQVETVERKGVDIMIALDISNSMMAEDIKPSRLERAKQAIYKMMDNMHNDRIGLVIFAGKAFLQTPLTVDYGAVKMMLSTVNPSYISVQGTALADAIKMCAESLGGEEEENKSEHGKVIIVITDGENHIGDAEAEAKNAADKGFVVYTIGIGSPEGAPIPVFSNGHQAGFKKDKNGATVVTKLDENTLKRVAEIGNGSYIRANTARVGLDKIFDQINKMDTAVFDSQRVTDYKDGFQYCLAPALLLLVIFLLIPNRSSNKINIDKLLERK
ncbi:MAG: VWA domain-containing protein [Bacteroidales bacterium]|nr:VWA domain-containing protein [Bacteroidales bacterium]MBR5720267.1 VWA domain-containing protein [Bacteroidales bacterium]